MEYAWQGSPIGKGCIRELIQLIPTELKATMPKKMSELPGSAHHVGDAKGGPMNEHPSEEHSSSAKRQPKRNELRVRPCYDAQSRTQ